MTDFSSVLCDLSGQEIVEPVNDGSGASKLAPLTLGRVAANALIQVYPDEANVDGAVKVRRFALAMKAIEGRRIKLEQDEIELIKERIAKGYGPLIVGRAWALLDPQSVKV